MKPEHRTLIDHSAHEEVLGYDPEEYVRPWPSRGTTWTRIAVGAGIVIAGLLYGLGALLGAVFSAGR